MDDQEKNLELPVGLPIIRVTGSDIIIDSDSESCGLRILLCD